jgi:hypothetical protein
LPSSWGWLKFFGDSRSGFDSIVPVALSINP